MTNIKRELGKIEQIKMIRAGSTNGYDISSAAIGLAQAKAIADYLDAQGLKIVEISKPWHVDRGLGTESFGTKDEALAFLGSTDFSIAGQDATMWYEDGI